MADIGLILPLSHFNFSNVKIKKTNHSQRYYQIDQTSIEGEIMKSKIGLSFCIVYLLLTAFCLYIALDPMTDNKGNFVFLQLPIGFQVSAFNAIGLGALFDRLSWTQAQFCGSCYFAASIWDRVVVEFEHSFYKNAKWTTSISFCIYKFHLK